MQTNECSDQHWTCIQSAHQHQHRWDVVQPSIEAVGWCSSSLLCASALARARQQAQRQQPRPTSSRASGLGGLLAGTMQQQRSTRAGSLWSSRPASTTLRSRCRPPAASSSSSKVFRQQQQPKQDQHAASDDVLRLSCARLLTHSCTLMDTQLDRDEDPHSHTACITPTHTVLPCHTTHTALRSQRPTSFTA